MLQTPLEHRLTELVEPLLSHEGYALVQLSLQGEGKGRVLQILTENPETGTVDLETCQRLSRTIGTHLEVENLISGAYRLEISSPGIDRPLVKIDDYRRFQGLEARIDMAHPIGTQKRFHGRIEGAPDDDTVVIQTETATVALPFSGIARAKLKMSDELIEFSRRQQAAKPLQDTQQGAMK